MIYRLWPGQFTQEIGDGDAELSVSFFIGLSTSLSLSAASFLLSFENQLLTNEQYYDPASCYLSVEVVGGAQLSTYKLKKSVFSPPLDETEEVTVSDSSSERSEVQKESEDRRVTTLDPLWDSDAFKFSKDLSRRQYKSQLKKKTVTPHCQAPKLRTSTDVYNRLMWDSGSGDLNDFVIGYEDRFTGLKEITLSSWKRDVSDREFVRVLFHLPLFILRPIWKIPFHRIVYFRRRNDDCIIWDKYVEIFTLYLYSIVRCVSGV
jgi:uncharacterized protein (UPF0248 family)